jgi:hypothetical protein
MKYLGMDVHGKATVYCLVDAQGEVVERGSRPEPLKETILRSCPAYTRTGDMKIFGPVRRRMSDVPAMAWMKMAPTLPRPPLPSPLPFQPASR